jgi:hypothetical protein
MIGTRFACRLVLATGSREGNGTAVFEGERAVTLVEGSDDALRAELARYAAPLSSPNRQENAEAAEALAFLDTPLSVDDVLPMLLVDNLEIIGLRALGRHRRRRPRTRSSACLRTETPVSSRPPWAKSTA